MKIAILGTRGIPNQYGGFEQCAQYLSQGLTAKGHSVFVYNSHSHPYKETSWNGVQVIHKFDPENSLGTIGQFIYDFNCIMDSRNHDFDVILQLGYTSSSIWHFLLPVNPYIITNMDGLEWKRSKYSRIVQFFLKYAEKIAVKNSDYLIADSVGIQDYLEKKYNISSFFIPYGAEPFNKPNIKILNQYGLTEFGYDIIIARLEPENNIEVILTGISLSKSMLPIIVIGNHQSKYGRYLKTKFGQDSRIMFLGPIYDINILNNLRYYSNVYFHGHTVGGTNPSLLEAMASKALICAHKNQFNVSILGTDSFYFEDANAIQEYRETISKGKLTESKVNRNYEKVLQIYKWEVIVEAYERVFIDCFNEKP